MSVDPCPLHDLDGNLLVRGGGEGRGGGRGERPGDHDVGLGLAVVGVADGGQEEVGPLGV